MNQFPGGGGGGYGGPPGGNGGYMVAQIQQEIANLRQEMHRQAGGVRQLVEKRMQAADQKLNDLAQIAQALRMSRTGGGIVRVEDIPGRRVPYVLVIDIPIGPDEVSVQEDSVTISQEGPFVAVRKMATFMSALEYQVTFPDESKARFTGRSFGRYRPIHSAWDINDAQSDAIFTTPNPIDADGIFAALGYTSTKSTYRSMEFDGRIEVINAGSSYPRQNISVPSSLWTPQINAPQDLGCLDFFERGEVITARVTPNHANNPPFGNADGLSIFGVEGWPFVEGQFDPQEGIVTPAPVTDFDPFTAITTDRVTRLPNGLFTIAWEGYRIIQPVGPIG
jgi:hypothetical protein